MGACGIVANDSQMIVAISKDVYDAFGKGTAAAGNPNLNVVCGRKIRARRAGTSGGVEVTVVDRCVGCAPTDLDFSPKAFLAVGATAEGRVPIEWAWV